MDGDLRGSSQYGQDGLYCLPNMEAASSIKFQNGVVIESECIQPGNFVF